MTGLAHPSKTNLQVSERTAIALLLVAAIVLFLPTAFFGIPDIFDLHQHMQFSAIYFDSLSSGTLVPGWSAAENHGFGGNGIRIYPPLAHYVIATVQMLTRDWYASLVVTFMIWSFIGALGIFLFAREWVPAPAAFLAALLYSCAPYRLGEIYQTFLYSEFAAGAILPFVFHFITRVCRGGKWADANWLGLFLALLVLSHIPTAIIGITTAGIYTLLIVDFRRLPSLFPKLAAAGALGLLASSFYWLRLITEFTLVKHSSPIYAEGRYDFHRSLFPQIFHTYEEYVLKQMWGFDLIALMTLILLFPTVFAAVRRRATDRDWRIFLAMALTGLFAFMMASIVSVSIWENVGFIRKIQFPFRWLSVATVFGALGFVITLARLVAKPASESRVRTYVVLAFCLVIALFDVSQVIIPSEMIPRDVFQREKIDGIMDKRSFIAWWPVWAEETALDDREPVRAGGRGVTVSRWAANDREFTLDAGPAVAVRVATFYYPHWTVTVNGNPVAVTSGKDGTIVFEAPDNAANVAVRFREPWYLSLAKTASAIALLLSIGFAIVGFRSRRPISANPDR